ncbi:hypothetical protein [Sandarakinorhabdus sp.]|uniref:hypothetical protein n=1 Tax=Sandarakinorhabdus sp. TaxID=1916663 RepID=UPI0035679A8C
MSDGFAAPGTVAPAVLPAAFVTPQGVVVLRFGSATWISSTADDPPNTPYPARLLGDVEVSQSAVDALFIGGRMALGVADIALFDADGAADTAIRYGIADGRNVVIRVAAATTPNASNVGTALGSAAVAFRGIVRAVNAADGQSSRLSVVDLAEALVTPLQLARYTGGGGLEGEASLKDRPKPIAFGRAFNVGPVFLGNVNLGDGSLPTFQSHWRAIAAHDAVRIRGAVQTAVLVAPTVGQYRDWPASGVFQLGSSPDGPVTADVRGDAVPVYVSTTSAILRRLVQSLGPLLADGAIETDSFGFADGDLAGEIGWYRGAEEISASDAVQQILAGSGAVLAGGRAGALRLFDPLAVAAEQFALPAPWIIGLQPLSLPAGMRPLPRAVTVDWRRNWTRLTDVPGSLATADRAQLQGANSGPARSESAVITGRVAQQRELRLPGLYWAEADALARAAKYRAWFELGPRLFEVSTDRYLGQIESGDIGRITYPAFGLDAGVRVCVVGWREQLGARRLWLTVVTLPEF